MNATTERKMATIFQEPTGWFICDSEARVLDARGTCYPSRIAAIRALRELRSSGQTDYTHYLCGPNAPVKL